MAEIELTRFAFLNKGGFKCPVCGEAVTYLNILAEIGVTLGQIVPTAYEVRCPRCGTRHTVRITSPAPPKVPDQEVTRFAFMQRGFTCAVEECGATITHNDVEETAQNTSPDPPMFYIVRCPRCRTSQVVNIKLED